MSVGNLEQYVDGVRRRYLGARKREKGRLLDGVCQTLACHRKAAIRLLRRPLVEMEPRRRRGRPKVYGVLVAQALRQVWEVSGESCSKRLAPFLPELVAVLERHGELSLTPDVRAALVRLGPTTIDRLLKPYRLQLKRQPYGGSGGILAAIKAQVPVRTFGEWAGVRPGSIQADLVLHCGESTEGFYLTTLTAVDVASAWTERVAVWGKTQQAVTGALERVRRQLPMPLRELHTDNGSEFLNGMLQPYCREQGIRTTRGRPYKKNDQAWVEQKNWSAVREIVGYERYRSREALKRMGELYELERLYRNFFQPVRKLVHKERVGPKVHKRYDVAQTPYQRLLASGVLGEPTKRQLEKLYGVLNPKSVRRHIVEAQRALFAERQRREREHEAAEDSAPIFGQLGDDARGHRS